ncbi:hypothetical protein LguiA_023289 [Lonicera macranthoides]
MNQANQGNNSDASPGIPAKRKRGRPRKDPSLSRLDIARPPPGFEAVNGNQSRQVDPIEDSNDGVVGQAVNGVVEAVFDAGYLLAVKIGNSNTSLRGVVFKPGHYTPVTAENDVAPHLQMIRRNEIHFPMDQTRGRGHNQRSRDRNEQHISYLGNGSPPPNQVHRVAPRSGTLVTSKGKYASAIVAAPSVPPVGARGTVVPVVLQPVNLSNGLSTNNQVTSAASQAAHMMALKGKHVQTVTPISAYPPNGSTGTDQGLGSTNRAISQSQTSPQVTPPSVKYENGPFNQGTEFRLGDEAKSGEVIKGAQGSSQSSETHGEEREGSDMSEPLFIEPLQTIHTNHYNLSASIPRTGDGNRTGRMTELLLAVQENMPENHFPRVQLPAAVSNISFHEQQRSTETDVIGDENRTQESNS